MATAIIQARMSSSRLPGKVLKEAGGRPLLSWLLDQARAARTLGRLVVATSVQPTDHAIERACRDEGVDCFRGSLDDVLDRYRQAAIRFGCDTIVRLTADNPLVDPGMIDAVVEFHRDGGYDYAANTAPPGGTCPHGMDVEVFTRAALERAWIEALKPSEREHVTFHFWKNPDRFRTARYELPRDLSGYRLTVDRPQDLEVVRRVIRGLRRFGRPFRLDRIVNFLDAHDEIVDLNRDLPEHDGWLPALRRDRAAAP